MMSRMSERRSTTQRGIFALGLTGLLTLSACGGEPATEAASTTTVPATTATPTTATPTSTTQPATTTSTTRPATTTSTTSTLPVIGSTTVFETSTTLAVQETEPVAPPPDAYATEPVIEMGTISIPKIGVEMTMYEGIRLTTLDYGPGHWPGTALPGQAGNVVVGGHRTSKHRVFRNVDQLEPGDEIIFEDANGRHVYEVDRIEIVDPTAVWIVNPTETPTATLFACHPPGSTAQRIIVFADLATA